jgi:flagellar hook-associated protein 2
MPNFAIDGLISGLSTTDMVNKLMQVEAMPQTLLKTKSSDASKLVTALQSLNTKVAALATKAQEAAKAETWDLHTVTSTSDKVTAVATAGSQPSTLTFTVTQPASPQVTLVAAADLGMSFTVSKNGTTSPTIDATGGIDAVVTRINSDTTLGLSAVKVRTDTGDMLQLTAASGAVNAFTVDGAAGPIGSQVSPPADAVISLGGSTVTSSTNTFSGVLPGIDFTLTPASAGQTVTLTVTGDAEGTRKVGTDLVTSITAVLDEMSAKSSTSTTTGADGRSVVTGGMFSGDSAIRFLADDIRAAVSNPVGTRSPAEIGLSFDRYGKLSLDAAKFDKAMADDPAGTQAMLTKISDRVAKVADGASDSIDGSLTLKIKSQQSAVSDLGRQIEDWDRRLALRRSTLERTWSSLEVTLGRLQSQQSWMAGQLAGLPTAK